MILLYNNKGGFYIDIEYLEMQSDTITIIIIMVIDSMFY